MNDADLDRSYTALSHALAAVGPERSELLLAMVCLALITRHDNAGDVLDLIASAQQRCLQEPADGR